MKSSDTFDLVSIRKFSEMSAYTEAAVRRKITELVWREGEQYFRSPDGRIHISLSAVRCWIESGSPT